MGRYPTGFETHPLIIGDVSAAAHVHVFESQWDAFAACDTLGLHVTENVAVLVTYGAGNGGLVAGLIPVSATIYAWKQNDEPKNDRRAGDEWLRTLVESTGSIVKCVLTPELFKDLNEWTLKDGAGYEELSAALRNAQEVSTFPTKVRLGEGSGNSHRLLLAPHDDYPDPPPQTAYYGLAGEIVRRIEPHTEADPVALLFQLLAAFGNLIGRNQYIVADGARHYLNLYGVLVGQSSKSRKGTSWNHIANLMERVDPKWRQERVTNGLSSGEGLIWAVRDPIEEKKSIIENRRHTGEYETFIADHGEADKRLFVVESEFANVLKVMAREGSTLSPIIRAAWDCGELRTMVKNNPARSTGAHISIVGHITRDEFVDY